MGVTFIIGRAGRGKTFQFFQRIVEEMRARPLGPPIYWIVPRQSTFSAERDLTVASGLPGFCRARVVSFDALADEVLAQGGAAMPDVTAMGRQMIIGHLLRQGRDQLRFFRASARQPGLAASLDAMFDELERAGKSANDLEPLLAEFDDSQPVDGEAAALRAKLHDVQWLYKRYVAFLGQDRLDPHRRLERVIASIGDCGHFRQAVIYVSGFTQLTLAERRMLVTLAASCRGMEIALPLDPASPVIANPNRLPDEASLFFQPESTFRRLWFDFAQAGVSPKRRMLREPRRFREPTLGYIERELFGGGVTSEVANGIELHQAADRRAEVADVARQISKLLREGFRPRDVAVLTRDISLYHPLIDTVFKEHGIPYFVDRRRATDHHPLLQLIRSAFQIARFNWPQEAVSAILRCGLAGVTPDEADRLENYVLLHQIRGGVGWEADKPWSYRRVSAHRDDQSGLPESPEEIDAIRRRLASAFAPFIRLIEAPEPRTVREYAAALFELLERLQARKTLAEWAVSAEQHTDYELESEHVQIWTQLVEFFDLLVDLLGGEPLTPADFVNVMESGLEQFDLAFTPPTVDQVLIGQIDRTRSPEVRAAFVLGLNQGEFPRAFREESILSDVERRELSRRKIELDPDAERQRRDERLLAYFALTRASERLFISRAEADMSGRVLEPSPLWDDLRSMLPTAPFRRTTAADDATLAAIATPRQLVVAMMRWVRTGDTAPDASDATWRSLHHWLATQSDPQPAIVNLRSQAWPALTYTNEAVLAPSTAVALFLNEREVTARQLETFASCTFSHFAEYGLRLKERGPRGVTVLDLSHVYHEVLRDLVRDSLRNRMDWKELSARITPEELEQRTLEIGKTLREELMLSSARNRYLLRRVRRTLEAVLAAQCAMMRRGQFRPGFCDVSYGQGGRLAAVEVTMRDGMSLRLRGRIDRLDMLAGGQATVLDYKLGGVTLPLGEAYHGLSLQLLTHLLAVQASGEQLAGKPLTPAAAFYVQLTRQLGDVDHPDEALAPENPAFHLRVKPRGMLDGNLLPAFDAALDRGQSDVVNAYKKSDGGIGFRDRSDATEGNEFEAVLAFIRRRLGELADELVAGKVDVRPYRIARRSPCSKCAYRDVCRFDLSVNTYRFLEPLSRGRALDAMLGREAEAPE